MLVAMCPIEDIGSGFGSRKLHFGCEQNYSMSLQSAYKSYRQILRFRDLSLPLLLFVVALEIERHQNKEAPLSMKARRGNIVREPIMRLFRERPPCGSLVMRT